jgi:sugar phosphate isomerase/epimerase
MVQSRRNFLAQSALAVSSTAIGSFVAVSNVRANNVAAPHGMMLGFSTYGAKSLTTENAIDQIKEARYDSVEITVWPDWDAAPANMSTARRRSIRTQLSNSGLKLTSLMEHLSPESDKPKHQASLERLKTVYQLASDLCPENPPVVQTVLGGGNWNEKKSLFVDRVGDWATLGRSLGVVTCVKPHRGGGMSKPSEAVWLITQINEARWLKMVYDYSHYAFRDIPLKESIEQSLPHIGHVAVKDAVQITDNDGSMPLVEFRLPGEAGTIDFVSILRTLKTGGYTGDCEVSGMVSSKSCYDPITAMKTCYENMSTAFTDAEIPRL